MADRRSRRYAGVAAAMASVTLAAGCGMAPPGQAADQDSPVRVAAAFYPVQFLAERIGGPDAQVTGLTPPGTEPHDLALTGPGRAATDEADVVVYLGHDFQPDVSNAVQQREGRGQAVDALAIPGIDLQPPSPGIPGEEHTEHDGGEPDADPHVWLDPVRMQKVADALTRSLSQARPAKQAVFEHRRDALRAELGQLDAEFRAATTTCSSRTLITNHAAFGYLASRYGLHQAPIAGLSAEQEPDPATMAQVADEARRSGVHTIFAEEALSPKLTRAVAEQAGAQVAVLATLEFAPSAEDGAGGGDYLSRMRANAQALRNGLGCR